MVCSKVYVLITLDVHDEEGVPDSIKLAGDKLAELGAPSTFFYTASVIEKTRDLERLLKQGHEVGCHGLYHRGDDEHYTTMPSDKQRRYLQEATTIIRAATAVDVKSFRAPVYKISALTLRILQDLGYAADVSVNSRRLGLFGSEPGNFSWLGAPLLPYHPSVSSAFSRGSLKLWEIPVSAFMVPFVTAFGQLFGGGALKSFFHMLYIESLHTGKPIVYGCHPEEFNRDRKPIRFDQPKFSLSEFLPTKSRGINLRYRFFEYDPARLFDMTVNLFKYMKKFPKVEFITVRNYVEKVLNRAC